MTWVYRQQTGEMLLDGAVVGKGYSGAAECKNQPDLDCVKNRGPIPKGKWRIGPAFHHEQKGPLCIPLGPLPGTETYGRSGFLIHGDSRTVPGSASEGCIILGPLVRDRIAKSKDKVLEVVASAPVGMGDVHASEVA
jgi:hypothetical protein